jgi:hypothetical protein
MTATAERSAPRASALALLVLAAVIAAAVATSLVALIAHALGAGEGFMPLQPQAYLTFTVAGTLAALGGWVLVVRWVRRSARVLRVLVPVALLVSWVPDVVMLATDFLPGATPVGVVALMTMHALVAGAAVLAGRRIAPPQ